MISIKTRVYFDDEAVKKNKDKFALYGKKALIVTGHSSEKNGSLNDVKEVLDENKITYSIFNEVEENPSVETVMKGREFGLKENCEFLIAIGGGSIIDAAKAIAIMMRNKDKGEEYLYDESLVKDVAHTVRDNESLVKDVAHMVRDNEGSQSSPVHSLIAIPTTCGSGAEVTGNAVLTLNKNQTKKSAVHKLFPEYAFVDGKYILNAPDNLIKRTALDSLAHMIESFVNTKANEYTKQIARNAMTLWADTRKYLSGEEKISKEICDKLMLSSTYAGVCISNTGTSIPHRLSYRVTYGDKISHGLAVAYFLVNFLDECEEKDEILKLIGFSDINEFRKLVDSILADIKVDKELIIKGIDEILQNNALLNSVKFKVDKEVLYRIANIS